MSADAADLAIAVQLHLDAALEAIEDGDRAQALVKFAAVEEAARRAAAALMAETRAHIEAEARAALAAECAAVPFTPAELASYAGRLHASCAREFGAAFAGVETPTAPVPAPVPEGESVFAHFRPTHRYCARSGRLAPVSALSRAEGLVVSGAVSSPLLFPIK